MRNSQVSLSYQATKYIRITTNHSDFKRREIFSLLKQCGTLEVTPQSTGFDCKCSSSLNWRNCKGCGSQVLSVLPPSGSHYFFLTQGPNSSIEGRIPTSQTKPLSPRANPEIQKVQCFPSQFSLRTSIQTCPVPYHGRRNAIWRSQEESIQLMPLGQSFGLLISLHNWAFFIEAQYKNMFCQAGSSFLQALVTYKTLIKQSQYVFVLGLDVFFMSKEIAACVYSRQQCT